MPEDPVFSPGVFLLIFKFVSECFHVIVVMSAGAFVVFVMMVFAAAFVVLVMVVSAAAFMVFIVMVMSTGAGIVAGHFVVQNIIKFQKYNKY